MSRLNRFWELLVRGLEWITSALFGLLALVVLWGVISRYVPGIKPSDWTEELALSLLLWVSLLGAALTYRNYGHLGVDYFVGKLAPEAQRWVAVIVEIAALIFSGVALLYGGWNLVSETLATGRVTPFLQWQVGYLYLAIPACGFFIFCFAIEHLCRPNTAAATQSPKEG